MNLRNGHPERRRQQRGTRDTEPVRSQLVSMILGTFREMPGLCLHGNQAARLFGVQPTTCAVVLGDLVAEGKLRRGADGQYFAAQIDRTIAAPVISPPGRQRIGVVRGGH